MVSVADHQLWYDNKESINTHKKTEGKRRQFVEAEGVS